MPKGIPNKRYTPEFKKQVIETMLEEKLSYSETARRFDVSNHHRIQDWERIYLTEGPEGFAVERRGRKRKGSLNKVKELQTEYAKLLEEKKKIYAEYRRSREEMRGTFDGQSECGSAAENGRGAETGERKRPRPAVS